MKYRRDRERMTQMLTKRGYKFLSMASLHRKSHTDVAYLRQDGHIEDIDIEIDSCVMLDPAQFCTLVSNHSLTRALPSGSNIGNEHVSTVSRWNQAGDAGYFVRKTCISSRRLSSRPLTDEHLLITSLFLRSFAISTRYWL
jgi:hypothetical protein